MKTLLYPMLMHAKHIFYTVITELGMKSGLETGARRLARPSSTNVAGVERSCDAGIAGSFDDGAAIGEDGHFVGRDAETQQETILADFGNRRCDAAAQRCEIELPAALVNLDRIAAAHGQVGLGIAFEIAEVVAHAGAAGGVACHAHGLVSSGPNVKRNQTPAHRIRFAKEQLNRFGGFDRGNHTGGGAEHAHRIASVFSARACGLRTVIVSIWPP